jgi:hypothetical protein
LTIAGQPLLLLFGGLVVLLVITYFPGQPLASDARRLPDGRAVLVIWMYRWKSDPGEK